MIKKIYTLTLSLLLTVALSPVATFAANYTTSQNTIYKDNNPITLKGVNWFGFETIEALSAGGLHQRDYIEMIGQMKQLGINAVRLPFCPNTLRDQSVGYITFQNNANLSLQGRKSLGVLDAVIAELNKQQMYILLDHHRIDCQTIPELWYSASYSEQQWINDLTFVANRYRQYEYLVGIDLKNEPHGQATWGTGNTATDWNLAAEKAGESVLRNNNNLLILVEGIQTNPTCSSNIGAWWGGNFEPQKCTPINSNKIPANKLIFSPHVYGPDVYLQPYFSDPNFPQNLPAIWEQHFGFLTKQGFTVVPGEFGGKYGNGGVAKDVQFQDRLTQYLAENKICNSFYWDWNPDSGDTGGILQNDWRTPWNNKVQMLQKYWQSCQSAPVQIKLIPTSTPIASTPIPTSTSQPTTIPQTGSTIQVVAAGTALQGVYPELAVFLNQQRITTISNIRGNPNAGTFQTFTYQHSTKINQGDQIQLLLTNDASNQNEDRNIRIDKIIVDGAVYQTEDGSVYSTGSWSPSNGCGGGNKYTEWLHCPNGTMNYKINLNPTVPIATPTPVPTITPTASPTPITTTTIKIYAAGLPAGGIYPSLELLIKGQKVTTFSNIQGNPNARQFAEFNYTSNGTINKNDVRLNYVNDGMVGNEDRNVMIDRITINGMDYQTENPSTYTEGTWSPSNACGGGNKQSEWLHCPGFVQY